MEGNANYCDHYISVYCSWLFILQILAFSIVQSVSVFLYGFVYIHAFG